MLACYDSAKCDAKVDVTKYGETCGTTGGAILYFCSFIFLCMFLVSNDDKTVLRKVISRFGGKPVI